MRLMKVSLAGLVLAGILALPPAPTFARGGGGGGHGRGGGGHGGGHFARGGAHFAGGGSHFAGGGGHFAGGGGHLTGGHFAGFTGHSFAEHQRAHFAGHGDHFRDRDRFRHDGDFFIGDAFSYDYPYYGFDYPDYGYYDENADDYSDGQSSPAEVALSQETIVAVQQELSQLGYYHGPIDGLIGPQTTEAVRGFQSFDKLPVTGQIDGPTLKALQNS
jgi:hypothetical protein